MKVCIKYNQVEVALQALHGSVEKVVFGTASLRNKQKLQYLFLCLISWQTGEKSCKLCNILRPKSAWGDTLMRTFHASLSSSFDFCLTLGLFSWTEVLQQKSSENKRHLRHAHKKNRKDHRWPEFDNLLRFLPAYSCSHILLLLCCAFLNTVR